MKSFKQFKGNKMEQLVSDYFSSDKNLSKKAEKTLKNLAQSKFKDELAGLMIDAGANSNDFASIGLVESESPGTVTANIPDPAETMQGPMGGSNALPAEEMQKIEEEYYDQNVFLGAPVFDVPCDVHDKFRNGKNRYHRWDKYLDMEDENCQKLYNYAKTKCPKSMILRNKMGVMIHVRPEEYLF